MNNMESQWIYIGSRNVSWVYFPRKVCMRCEPMERRASKLLQPLRRKSNLKSRKSRFIIKPRLSQRTHQLLANLSGRFHAFHRPVYRVAPVKASTVTFVTLQQAGGTASLLATNLFSISRRLRRNSFALTTKHQHRRPPQEKSFRTNFHS